MTDRIYQVYMNLGEAIETSIFTDATILRSVGWCGVLCSEVLCSEYA